MVPTTDEKIQQFRLLEPGDLLICINDWTPIGGDTVLLHRGKFCEVRDFPGIGDIGLGPCRCMLISEKIGKEYGPRLMITEPMYVNHFTTLADYYNNKSYYDNLNTPVQQNQDSVEALAQDAIIEFTSVLRILRKYMEMWEQQGIKLRFDSQRPHFFKVDFTNNENYRREFVVDLNAEMAKVNGETPDMAEVRTCDLTTTTLDGLDMYD
jgi:hypothetical protein